MDQNLEDEQLADLAQVSVQQCGISWKSVLQTGHHCGRNVQCSPQGFCNRFYHCTHQFDPKLQGDEDDAGNNDGGDDNDDVLGFVAFLLFFFSHPHVPPGSAQ